MGRVDFLMDTGTDASILHPPDALALGFTLEDLVTARPAWGSRVELVGIGGRVACHRVRAIWAFQHEADGARAETSEGAIHIAGGTPENQNFPSLLGWDILQHFRLTADWSARELTLDWRG